MISVWPIVNKISKMIELLKKKSISKSEGNHTFPFRDFPWAMRDNSTMDRLKNHIMSFHSYLFNPNYMGGY